MIMKYFVVKFYCCSQILIKVIMTDLVRPVSISMVNKFINVMLYCFIHFPRICLNFDIFR